MALRRKHLRFGNFRLYPTEQLLLQGETPVPLAPKAFDILLHLVENGGHLVKRDELMQAIWPDSFVEETNLTVNVSLLRKVLGSALDGQPYIETVPRKGYRFTAAVTECEEEDTVVSVASEPKSESPDVVDTRSDGAATAAALELEGQPANTVNGESSAPLPFATLAKSRWRRLPIVSLAAIALLTGGFYLWLRSRSNPGVVSASARSIAILPFQSLDSAPQDEYLGLGMTDALITRLSNLHKIIVRPVSAVRKYATQEDPLAAGRQLAVQSVLEGSVQRSGDRTRVTVRLLRVSDGELLWGSTFDEKFTDMFSVEDSISQEVASALMVNLSGDDQKRLTRPFTANNGAYQLYMKGRYFWNKRTVDGVRKSLAYFQQAIASDPQYAVAYAGLADAYTAAGSYGYSILPPREAMPQAEAAAKKALAIDDTLAEAHASLAYIKFIYDWDWAGAEQEFKRAIALNPAYDTAHHWYSHELMAMGRTDEAMDESRRAIELSPSDTVINEHLGWTYLMSRDYPHAAQSAGKALELDPNFLLAHRILAQADLYQGNYSGAIEEFQRGVDLSHGDPVSKAYLARAYAVSGRKDDAFRLLQELRQLSNKQYVPPAEIAEIQAALGQNEEAFRSLAKAFEDRESALVYLKVDRGYDPIRSDPRFAGLLKRLNL